MMFSLEKGDYCSPDHTPNYFFRAFPGVFFYTRMFLVVFRSAKKAQQNRYDDAAWQNSSVQTREVLESVGVNIQIRGFENVLALQEPFVLVGNHMSTLETFLLPGILLPHRRHTYVIKDSLVKYPIFKHVMMSRDPICVSRVNPREDLKIILQEGQDRLKKGLSVVIFPPNHQNHRV